MNVTGATKSVEEHDGCGGRAGVRSTAIEWKARWHRDHDGRSMTVGSDGREVRKSVHRSKITKSNERDD